MKRIIAFVLTNPQILYVLVTIFVLLMLIVLVMLTTETGTNNA